ncbi:MAG TPA: hypothetical protein VHU22_14715 [Xanthobacteraceae bacterium]|jgi:hypothetical protein|nr:hypothetical protein [Xanthobacteraceae bacterium]
MSIYVYVTRRADPLDDTGPKITRDEWLQLIAEDPELSLEDPADRFPGYKDAIYAAWKNYPGGYTAWFVWFGGNIEIKGLDEALLGKLRAFAAPLNARIVSEEGEEFS